MQGAIRRFRGAQDGLWRLRAGLCVLCLVSPSLAQLTVAVAANVQFAMEELKIDFQRRTGVEVNAAYGSSGKWTTQIRHGAPFDVFVSADMNFPDTLYRSGYASAPPILYAYGKLVLWAARDLDLSPGLSSLENAAIEKIALADPRLAPYGREAEKAMRRAGVFPRVESKLVFGENISQVSQYILSGHANVGFSAKSVVTAPVTAGKGHWVEVDSALYDPIAQGAVILKYGAENRPRLSQAFCDYLHSESARSILAQYGYGLP